MHHVLTSLTLLLQSSRGIKGWVRGSEWMFALAKRSWLYIPCSDPKKINKAIALRNVDAMIFDLEDSVPLNKKVSF
jgi:hypothetical protein